MSFAGVSSEVKAWVNWDGATGTGTTIRASLNVSSITYNANGDYTVNFATALTDGNYAVAFGSALDTTLNSGQYARFATLCSQALSSSSFRIRTFLGSNTNTSDDLRLITAIVIR